MEEEAFRRQVHEFLGKEVTEDAWREAELGELGPSVWALLRKLGAKRWLAPSWPVVYGGLGAPRTYTYIAQEELAYYQLLPEGRLIGQGIVGPVLMKIGTEEQKRQYLPRIASGAIEFCLGYTEPQAGSDLASLETRARQDGDVYVITGQKLFNSRAHSAQYHWLAARTDATAPKHKGISLFIIDSQSPGITVRPLWRVDGKRTNEVFYDEVRVPKQNLAGEQNRGWFYLAGGALTFERFVTVGYLQRTLEELVEFAKHRPLARKSSIRQALADIAIKVQVAKLFAWRMAWMTDQNVDPRYEGDALFLFTTELRKQLANVGMQIIGLYGLVQCDSPWAQLGGRIEGLYRDCLWHTIAGGTSEIQRNIIAIRGLGLPKG